MHKGFQKQRWLLWVCSIIFLSGCETESNFAPVSEASGIEPIPKSGMHRVAKGESVYEIAWRYGLDYRNVAKTNHLNSPYAMKKGQVIDLKKASKPALSTAVSDSKSSKGPLSWQQSAKGRLRQRFSSAHKGINIGGILGQPIYAAANGQVVYSGDGLRRYGNLILIMHNQLYLSAYAYNLQNLVKEGDWVKKGQIIARMGKGESGSPELHFEIRKAGKPVDPSFYLNQS